MQKKVNINSGLFSDKVFNNDGVSKSASPSSTAKMAAVQGGGGPSPLENTNLSFIQPQHNLDRSDGDILDMLTKPPSEQARPSMRRSSILQKKFMNKLDQLEQDIEGDDSD